MKYSIFVPWILVLIVHVVLKSTREHTYGVKIHIWRQSIVKTVVSDPRIMYTFAHQFTIIFYTSHFSHFERLKRRRSSSGGYCGFFKSKK